MQPGTTRLGAKPWAVFFPDGARHDVDMRTLTALVTDMTSWHSFLVMLCEGTPARMLVVRDDGPRCTVVVVRARHTHSGSNYHSP